MFDFLGKLKRKETLACTVLLGSEQHCVAVVSVNESSFHVKPMPIDDQHLSVISSKVIAEIEAHLEHGKSIELFQSVFVDVVISNVIKGDFTNHQSAVIEVLLSRERSFQLC